MPQSQIASVATKEFGAPVVEAEVLRLRARHGGKVDVKFENAVGDADVTVSLQVSDDGVTPVDTTDADNLKAVVDEVIKRGTEKNFTVLLRDGVDNYLVVLASGGARCTMQYTANMDLEDILI